jgi:hypothetical protein
MIDLLVQLTTRLIVGVMSVIDASSLRSKLYQIKEEHEIMWTALDDIARMYAGSPAGNYAKEALNQINGKYGN